MNILITGAKGFVGKNLAANLYCIKDGKNRTRDLTIEEIAVYGARRSPFRFRTAAFRSKTAVHFS